MKRYFCKVLIFLLPVMMTFWAIELFYRYVPNDYSEKFKYIPKRYNGTEVLIFGNSHPFYGLNPEYFTKPTYNMSIISQTLYYDKLLFDKYIDEFKDLKTVIFHIEYTSLSEIVESKENKWRKYYYAHYMELEIPNNTVCDSRNYFVSFTRDFNSNLKLISTYLQKGTIVNTDENGFGTNYTYENREEITEKSALKRISNIEDNLIYFTDNVNILQEMIDSCRERGIKVVLLTLPNTKYFYRNVNQTKLEKMFRACEEFTLHNDNVKYLNLLKDSRFDDNDFYDADHLNSKGAVKSSMIVNEFLENNIK